MKKLVTAFAACALAGAVFAQVESVNVVGYTSTGLNASRFFMYGMNFDKVGGGDLKVSDLIPSVGWTTDQDQIQIANVNPTTGIIEFDIYTYFNYDPNYVNFDDPEGWYDASGTKVNDTLSLSAGLGFWIKTATEQTVTVAGQVVSDAAVSFTATANRFMMVANAYPVALNPNTDFVVTAGGFTTDLDQIQVANVNQTTGLIEFDIYTYFNYDPNYVNFDDPEGWYDASGTKVSTDIIPANTGFWFKAANAVTFEIASPL